MNFEADCVLKLVRQIMITLLLLSETPSNDDDDDELKCLFISYATTRIHSLFRCPVR